MSNELQDEYQGNEKDLIEKLKKEHEVKQLSDYKFPTEIIDLPSKGLIYPKDNPLSSGKIEIKYMTAKEEDILSNQAYIQKGVVLDKLLRSLIVNKDINIDDLANRLRLDKNKIKVYSQTKNVPAQSRRSSNVAKNSTIRSGSKSNNRSRYKSNSSRTRSSNSIRTSSNNSPRSSSIRSSNYSRGSSSSSSRSSSRGRSSSSKSSSKRGS